MNKMDHDFNPALDAEEETKPRSPVWMRRAAVIGAPLGVIAVAVAGFAILDATGPKPDKNKEPPGAVAVQVAPAQARETTISVTTQGEARPRVEATLASQVSGRLLWTSPAFVEGGAFREGDVLARIDTADYQLAVTRAQAQVAQAQEGLAREEAEGEIARQDWAELGQGDASPLALREPQLAQARATLAAAQAQLREAQLNLSRTSIRAPFSGRLSARRANVGDLVTMGSPVADVFATDIMEVRVPLTDADLAALDAPVGYIAGRTAAPAAHLSATIAGERRTWNGRLMRIESTVDSQTRLVYGIIEVRDPFGQRRTAPLAPGVFVTAVIDGARTEQFVAAPRGALKRNEYVYVIDNENKVDVRQVRAAQTTATEVLFRQGVADGERVVVSHLPSPRDGMSVTPIDRAPDAEAAPAAARPAQ
ncbi:MAG: efflux RND transporter periplasmic adaptor subunit [Alphaproteobacteria bacterium]|nr:efflux RND transporter periplasmic adaptor subunit [Alphaproteobacteria bacterium]